MKKLILLSGFVSFVYMACSMQPAIVRTVYPVQTHNTAVVTNYTSTNRSTLQQDNIVITLQYLNKKDLYYLAKKNKNPYTDDGVAPVLSVFKIIIKNNSNDKIKIDKDLIVLLDGTGHQYNALNYDSYRQMYPATYERSSDYSFLFGQTFIEPKSYSSDYYKREEVKRTLFSGGYIYKNVEVTGILSFPRLSELVKKFTIIIPDVEVYEGSKVRKKTDFNFVFIQTIDRIGQ